MPDWSGAPAAILNLHFNSPGVQVALAHDRLQIVVFLTFGFVAVGLFAYFVHLWVTLPLAQISQAMESRSKAPLAPLLSDGDEVGQLARLVSESFEQQAVLSREISERQRIESALRQSETSLRDSLRTRTELGRNLHDGVIQSLYASGIAIATAEAQLQTSPEEAIKVMAETRTLLNDVIRDVRDFIIGLEPESLSSLSFVDAVRKVFEQMASLGPCDFSVDIPEELVQGLQTSQRVQLLHILREALSNAIRHGRATLLSCTLFETEGGLMFEISDNGIGFDSATTTPPSGHGLRNLMERSALMGGRLTLDSTKGEGTHLRVLIPSDGIQ